MDIRLAIPDELDDYERREALNSALESVTKSVSGLVRRGIVPPAAGMIKARRVRWQAEPPGAEHFDLPATVIQRGWGDCDDLAPWHAGSLRAGGIDPGARAIVKKSGPKRWHALVQRSDGSIEDPSAAAGMHSVSGGGAVGAGAPIHPPMSADGRLCLAICPSRDRRHPLVWFARCDVPDRLDPWDWSTAAAHPSPKDALLRAIKTARHVAGEDMDPEDEARLACLTELVCGADPHEVADELDELVCGAEDDDEEEREQMDVDQVVDDAVESAKFLNQIVVGSFWDTAKRALASSPLGTVTQFIPGMPAATAPAPGGMPGGPRGHGSYSQQMPIMQMREFLAQNPQFAPLAQMALPLAGTMFGGPFGAAGGNMLAQFVSPQQGGGTMPGGGGMMPGGFDPMSLLSMFGGMFGGGGGGVPQQPGWAPPSFAMDRGVVMQPQGGGPSFMRF